MNLNLGVFAEAYENGVDFEEFVWLITSPGTEIYTVKNGIFTIALTTNVLAFYVPTDMMFFTVSIVHTTFTFTPKAVW